jgi:hypothetical protein
VARERAINPFLRTTVPAVRAAAAGFAAEAGLTSNPSGTTVPEDDNIGTLAALREWKNRFR